MAFKRKAEEARVLGTCAIACPPHIPLLKCRGQHRRTYGKETNEDHLCSNRLTSSRKPGKQKSKKQHLFKTDHLEKCRHSLKGEQMEKTSAASQRQATQV